MLRRLSLGFALSLMAAPVLFAHPSLPPPGDEPPAVESPAGKGGQCHLLRARPLLAASSPRLVCLSTAR